jgi:hypothetical protein
LPNSYENFVQSVNSMDTSKLWLVDL